MTEEQIRQFEQETDPAKRKNLLEETASDDDPVFVLRRKLFHKRFGEAPSGEGQYIDAYMRVLLELIQANTAPKDFFGSRRKQILKLLQPILDDVRELRETEGEAVLHAEWKNAVRRYFETCLKSGYRRKWFGVAEPGEEERSAHIRKDALGMSYGVASKYKLEQEMSFLCRVVEEAYAEFAPEKPALSG